MRFFLAFLTLWIVSCPQASMQKLIAEETNADRCHVPVKIIDTGERILIKTVDNNCNTVDEVELEKPKPGEQGPKGDPGPQGQPGPRGPSGSQGPAGTGADSLEVTICEHGDDHIYRSVLITLDQLIQNRWGEKGQFDFAGHCTDGPCHCDLCPLQNFDYDPSQIKHFHRNDHDREN